MRIVLLGPPGAGKGTQATTLAHSQGVPHIASGDLFRDHQRRDTALGRQARSYMEQGQLVPDAVTIEMIRERTQKPDCHQGFVLDGFPRTLAQANSLEELLQGRRISLDKVLYIMVSEGELVQRLGGRIICRDCQTPYNLNTSMPKSSGICDNCQGELYQRADDTPKAVSNRIKVYLEETQPLIEHYERQSLLASINGEQEIDQVGKALTAALES